MPVTEKTITLVNKISQLEKLADSLESVSKEWRLPDFVTLNLNLVLEELFSNIVFYGYEDENEHEIRVLLSFENKVITLQVEDDAREFNPLLVAHPVIDGPIEEREIGGLGIHLVRRIMDEITYEHQEGKNILTLRKKIV